MYVKASDWEIYEGKNPADRIKKFAKHSRERFVQSHEMSWLLKALAEELPQIETFFLCLLLTGARRDEARLMMWAHVDLDRALWHKPTTKTGVPHTISLPAQLVTRLQQLPCITEWVFPSSRNSKNGMKAGEWSVTAVEHRWRRIRRRVGLTDVRIHDLNSGVMVGNQRLEPARHSVDAESQIPHVDASLCTLVGGAGSPGPR